MPEPDEISIEEIQLEAEDRMEKSLDAFKRDMQAIRSSRASPAMVQHLTVDYYGTATPLQQLATINVPEARMLTISPYDKSVMTDIEKAILKSDLNLTPQNDGNLIRLILPELSGERRQELVKQLKNRLEEARVSIRNIRRDSNDAIKKIKGLPEDEIRGAQDDVQKLTDRFIGQAEELARSKEQEITTI
ncbi:MAG: ribosome recycling factor [Spirochaetales bacterium]|nr:ribosome recycling factor [Spirochaetales bacterium]